jgi:hypothetical protein
MVGTDVQKTADLLCLIRCERSQLQITVATHRALGVEPADLIYPIREDGSGESNGLVLESGVLGPVLNWLAPSRRRVVSPGIFERRKLLRDIGGGPVGGEVAALEGEADVLCCGRLGG